jgi:hypothetical protein
MTPAMISQPIRRFELDNATRLSLRAIAPDHYQTAAGVGIATSLSILYEAFYFRGLNAIASCPY